MNRVKALRESFGKTLRDVEAETGVTRSSLQRIEAEIGEPSYYSIERLADYFRVTIDYLMMRDTSEIRKGGLDDESRKAVETRLEIQRLMQQLPTRTDSYVLEPIQKKARLPKKRNEDTNQTRKGIKPRERYVVKTTALSHTDV